MMDASERRRRIDELLGRARVDPFIPWWAMDLIRIVEDLVTDVDDLGGGMDKFDTVMVSQQKQLNGIDRKYSELLYKLKSGD